MRCSTAASRPPPRPIAQLGDADRPPRRRPRASRSTPSTRIGDHHGPDRRRSRRAAAARLLRARAARAGDRAGRLDQRRDHRVPGAATSRAAPAAASPTSRSSRCWCGTRTSSSPSTGSSPPTCASDPAWARGRGGARRPRAPVARAAVRLGRFPAVGQPADRPVVAGQDPLSGAVPGGLARAARAISITRFYHVTPTDAQIDRVLAGRDLMR